VSPNYIGGMRMSAEMLRPHVVEFLDEMLRDKDKNLRIEEVAIGTRSQFIGQTLGSSRFRQVADVLVLAIRDATKGFVYNPGPDLVLADSMKLIVLGPMDAVHKLKDLLSAA
jgi:voltage-gated potassium channel